MCEPTSASVLQVLTLKASNMQRLVEVVRRMAQKSCRRAFQFLCYPIDTLWCEEVTCCPGNMSCLGPVCPQCDAMYAMSVSLGFSIALYVTPTTCMY